MAGSVILLNPKEFDLSQKKRIGSGAASDFWSIPWKTKKKRIAAKPLQIAHDSRNEAESLAKISCRHIVEFYGIANFDSRHYLVMELAEFGSLDKILESSKSSTPPVSLTDDLCFDWTVDISKALNYLHNDLDPGIIHGNLKSSNVLIVASGPERRTVAKICGFGQIRPLESTSESFCRWSPPELLRQGDNGIPSTKSDIWSFGATVVEIFTRQKPYEHLNENIDGLLQGIINKKLNPLHNLPQNQLSRFPESLLNILPMCFKWEMDKRCDVETFSRCLVAAKTMKSIGIQAGKAQFHVIRWKTFDMEKDFDIDLVPPIRGHQLRSAIKQKLGLLANAYVKLWQCQRKRRSTGEILLDIIDSTYANEQGETVPKEDVEENYTMEQIEDNDIVVTAENKCVKINMFEIKE